MKTLELSQNLLQGKKKISLKKYKPINFLEKVDQIFFLVILLDKDTQFPEIPIERKVINNVYVPHSVKVFDGNILDVCYVKVEMDRLKTK